MNKLFKTFTTFDLKTLALEGKFYSKRKHDTKLEWCEDFLTDHFQTEWPIEPLELLNWLCDNPPLELQKQGKPRSTELVIGSILEPNAFQLDESKNGVFVTAAQNNTVVDQQVFERIKDYCDSLNLQLIVLPIYYNKNSFSAAVESEDERFSECLAPYMVYGDSVLFEGKLVLRPEAAVLPTAKMPVNKAVELNQGEASTVIAATKQQHKTLPRSPATAIREAWTTGVVTVKNYIRGGAGASAANQHKFGGIIYFQHADGLIMSRNVQVKGGELCDIQYNSRAQVMTLGDLHSERKHLPTWEQTTALVEEINPDLLVVHDILHFETASHHNRNDGKHLYKSKDKQVIDDLHTVINDLNELAMLVPEVYVVESNHNSALDNWLHDTSYNPKRDPRQAKLYYLLNWLVCDAIDSGQDETTALEVAFDNLSRFKEFPPLAENVRFGSMDKAEIWCNTDFSQHGHKGQNGSGGNTNMFSKWCQPMVTGHTHSPAIIGDTTTVGVTASLNQGYNRGGASSWRQSHAVTHKNGFTQLVHVWAI